MEGVQVNVLNALGSAFGYTDFLAKSSHRLGFSLECRGGRILPICAYQEGTRLAEHKNEMEPAWEMTPGTAGLPGVNQHPGHPSPSVKDSLTETWSFQHWSRSIAALGLLGSPLAFILFLLACFPLFLFLPLGVPWPGPPCRADSKAVTPRAIRAAASGWWIYQTTAKQATPMSVFPMVTKPICKLRIVLSLPAYS